MLLLLAYTGGCQQEPEEHTLMQTAAVQPEPHPEGDIDCVIDDAVHGVSSFLNKPPRA